MKSSLFTNILVAAECKAHNIQVMFAYMYMYMFGAICYFVQFQSCAVQIRNSEVMNQFQNCATTFAQFQSCVTSFEKAVLSTRNPRWRY